MRKKTRKPSQEGDVIGISDARSAIPRSNVPKGGHPQGIEAGTDRTAPAGTRDIPQKAGATSIDIGAGGDGNAIRGKR